MKPGMTTTKLLALVNHCACMLWLGATVWFQPELTSIAKYQTYPACYMFLSGIVLFASTTAYNLIGACKGGAPFIMRFNLAFFMIALIVVFLGVLGLLPSVNWGLNAVLLMIISFSMVLYVACSFLYFTYFGCKASGMGYWPCLPHALFAVSVAMILIGSVGFHFALRGLFNVYDAVTWFQAATYPLNLWSFTLLLFPPHPSEMAQSPELQQKV